MTTTPERPSVRSAIMNALREHPDGMSGSLLIALVAWRADASAMLVRTTLKRLEREGVVYHGTEWKVTRP